ELADGDEVVVVWGEDPISRKHSVDRIHRQMEIRATVTPARYQENARTVYRADRARRRRRRPRRSPPAMPPPRIPLNGSQYDGGRGEEDAVARGSAGLSVLSRHLRILESFDAWHPFLTLSEIAQAADLPRSSTHRLVAELEKEGLL